LSSFTFNLLYLNPQLIKKEKKRREEAYLNRCNFEAMS